MRRTGLLAGAIALFGASVQGATISSLGPVELGQSTVGTGTSIGSLGYTFATVGSKGFFYQPGGSPYQDTNLPSYIAIHYASALDYYSGGYAAINISGTATTTGYGYYPGGSVSTTTPSPLMTVTLGTGVPSSFELGVLEDNTGNINENTSVVFAGTDGTSETVNSPAATQDESDDFYYVNVTNAAPGDVINISGVNPSGGSTGFGGIVFDPASPVPEPVSLGLLGVAGGFLSLRRRRA